MTECLRLRRESRRRTGGMIPRGGRWAVIVSCFAWSCAPAKDPAGTTGDDEALPMLASTSRGHELESTMQGEVDASGSADEVVAIEPPGTVRYLLTWDDAGIDMRDGAWTTTNDLGYRVTLTKGYVVSLATQLTLCQSERAQPLRNDQLEDNPTLVLDPLVEDMMTRAPIEFGEIDNNGSGPYCKGFYLLARGEPDTRAMPSEPDLVGISIAFVGSYMGPEGGEAQAFEISTSFANGLNSELVDAQTEMPFMHELDARSLELRVTRKTARIFDGIDFRTHTGRQLEIRVAAAFVKAVEMRAHR